MPIVRIYRRGCWTRIAFARCPNLKHFFTLVKIRVTVASWLSSKMKSKLLRPGVEPFPKLWIENVAGWGKVARNAFKSLTFSPNPKRPKSSPSLVVRILIVPAASQTSWGRVARNAFKSLTFSPNPKRPKSSPSLVVRILIVPASSQTLEWIYSFRNVLWT